MNKRWLLVVLVLVVLSYGSYASTRAHAASAASTPQQAQNWNAARVEALLDEMRHTDLDQLAAIEIKPLALPEAGVDVMRVRLEETYDVAGVGKDTIELKGWIAVKHDNTRPAEGEDKLTWNSAITDTQFVGLELHGESPLFGPVEIRLDKTQPSVGHVGKLSLPFAVGSLLHAAYRPYRTHYEIDQVAANRVQGPAVALVANPAPPAGKGEASTIATGAKARPVVEVIDGVLKAISAKDAKAMSRYYSPSGNNLFFGPVAKGVARGSEDYIRELSKNFNSFKTFEAKRNDDVQVRLSGTLAVATLTGVNNVVDAKGQSGSSPWQWTVELEHGSAGWRITHDHISFFTDSGQPIDRQQLGAGAAGAAACRADVAVSVNMKALGIEMRTATPVEWYSEVVTIPPVGAVASVSVAPVSLVSQDRKVGTLEHGAVKFREVVRHVPLLDVAHPGLSVASAGITSSAGGTR